MDVLHTTQESFSLERASHVKHKSMNTLHSHGFYELYYLTEGTRKYFIDRALYTVEKGDVILLPPEVLHRSVGDDDGYYSRTLFNIPRTMLHEDFLPDYSESMTDYFYKIPQKRRAYFDALLDKIVYEYERGDRFSDYLLQSYVNEVFIFLSRVKKRSIHTSFDNETDKVIGKAARFIRENYEKNLSLAEVAMHVGMSKTYFSKLFKNKTGFGFSDYLTEVRIAEAARMLTDTAMDVTDIALQVGYNDSSYFATVFKRKKGMTPVKYRKSGSL